MVGRLWNVRTLFCVLPVFLGIASAWADERVNYAAQIKPVFVSRCVACHGVLKQEGGLRLDTGALAVKGGDSGPIIKPGDVAHSLLLKRIAATDPAERMPPEGEPLKPEQIAAIRDWIAQNAVAPADEQPERDPRDHWAFRPVTRPAIPQVEMLSDDLAGWPANPIDAFIAQQYRQHRLTPQAQADRRVWLRRVYLDLIGLPPSPAQLDSFVSDSSPEACDKVVTELLERPEYGQRWGRHWMDIWRYSDWWGLGAEVRNSQKHIWHWRDWIIQSLNLDKGYDQMLREMLAADEMYPQDLDRLRATGYLARQYFIFNRTSWLDETIEHTAKGMLGMTFNCAKCHDHKYDPLSQAEYYQLRAIFEPYQVRTEMVSGQIDFEKDGIPRAFDAHLDIPTYLHVRGDDRNPDKTRLLGPNVPAFLTSNDLKLKIQTVSLPAEAAYPGLRDFVLATHRANAEQQIAAARSALDVARKSLLQSEGEQERAQNAAMQFVADALLPANAPVEPLVRDNFSASRPDVWETLAGQWAYSNGRLVQSQAAATRAVVRLKPLPPEDFEARLKYIPTGGETWKSVGISFDVTPEGNEWLAYVSAVAGGPRSQIAYKQNGNYVYPPTATQGRKVELNEPHEIILQVRGTLINLTVDGEHSIAYRFPAGQTRQSGFLELITYDAKVEFLEFELRPLSKEWKLVDASSPEQTPATAGPLPVERARLEATIAQKSLAAAEARLASIEARAAADRFLLTASDLNVPASAAEALPETVPARTLALAAGRSEQLLAAALADVERSRAELAVMQAAADKKPDFEKRLGAATTAFEAATKALESPKESYTRLPGARKTQEDYQNRNADKPFPASSSGRRTAFAKWLTDPRNPLPARVAVNHIWMRHMGKPLVPTIFDFGRKGTLPTHPPLLDWLASEFVEHGWSMKHLHRLIVTSSVYRLSSSSAFASDATRTADPDNRLYWRMNPVRMDSPILRDSLLSLAGEIDLTLEGPSIAVTDDASRRRSLYYVHSHNDHQKFLSTFDDANVLDCYRRAESIVPQQALALENSSLAIEVAGKITQGIEAAQPGLSETDFVRMAFVTVLSAEPTSEERATMLEMLGRMTELARKRQRTNPEHFAKTNLVQTLLNHNDFITIR